MASWVVLRQGPASDREGFHVTPLRGRIFPQLILHDPQVVQAADNVGVVLGQVTASDGDASSWLFFAAAYSPSSFCMTPRLFRLEA